MSEKNMKLRGDKESACDVKRRRISGGDGSDRGKIVADAERLVLKVEVN
jgi:hypothetical protein